MRSKLIGVGLVTVILLSACGTRVEPKADLLRFLEDTATSSHDFVYTEKTKDQIVSVKGTVEDDLKVHLSLNVGGADVMQQLMIDDSLAVKVADPAKVPALQQPVVAPEDQLVLDLLRSGQWVLDPSGAPPLLPPRTAEGAAQPGKNHVLDAFYLFHYIRRAIAEGATVIEFNPDALGYLPQDDPFPKPEKDGQLKRYDVVPPPLPRRSERGTTSALPVAANFRKMAFYVNRGKVVRVLEEIDFESHRDFKRAREGKGPKYPLQLLAAVRAGRSRDPIRVRTMSFELSRIGNDSIRVTHPEGAIAADLWDLFGPRGLSSVAPLPVAPEMPAEPAGSAATATGT